MNLTIVYITNRDKPKIGWFTDSLVPQVYKEGMLNVAYDGPSISIISEEFGCPPKPTVWSGPDRVMPQDWWSAANARNTGICLCKTQWIAFVDDRSVLLPGWLDAVKRAMTAPVPYVVCGTYQKRTGITVENGVIKHGGIITGEDSRLDYCNKFFKPHGMKPPYKAPGEWTYGCAIALPLEWALDVGGFDETCDGLGGEDYIFGLMLQNQGRPIFFDPNMAMVEDRTPGETGPVAIRRDKGVSPNDKSHKLLNTLKTRKSAMHGFDIRRVREDALAGNPWPAPWGPTNCFFDGQPIAEMKPE